MQGQFVDAIRDKRSGADGPDIAGFVERYVLLAALFARADAVIARVSREARGGPVFRGQRQLFTFVACRADVAS